MYALAGSLTPESLHASARLAYRELAQVGVRTVGEFHYVHHQADGTPYDNRTELAEAVVEAARAEGLRIALLRVVYARAGAGRPPEGAQRRFCDPSLDLALGDVLRLKALYAGQEDVVVGVAPHSVRAVPPDWLRPLAAFAEEQALPLHMHVAEQPAEIHACLAETGRRPIELLADHGVLGPRFVGVHATHLAPHEPGLLGESGSFVCLCPTTERDLGDGLPDVGALQAAGVKLSVGIDSHVITNPLDELRGVELGERLRTGKRNTLRTTEGRTPAEELWHIGSELSAQACGFADAGGAVRLSRLAPELGRVREELLLDAIVYSATPAVFSGGGTRP